MKRTFHATIATIATLGVLAAAALLAAGRPLLAAGIAAVYLLPAGVRKLRRASRLADARVAEYRAATPARTATPEPKENHAA